MDPAWTPRRKDPMTHWNKITKLLHWLMALFLPLMILLGFAMTRSVEQAEATGQPPSSVFGLPIFDAFQLHKSVGFVLFLLVILRIVWRLRHRAPDYPQDMTAIERAAAKGVQALLFALMLIMPVSGWLLASASPIGIPTTVFGLFTLPDVIGSENVEPVLARVHLVSTIGLIALVGLHVAAALKHHFVDGDDILTAMLPRRNRS